MIRVRRAEPRDISVLGKLIDALADYEKLPRPDDAAKLRLERDLFQTEHPRIESLLCEADGALTGYTMFFETYSSFHGLPALYLEDLFVLPEYRGIGAGSALFRAVAQEAHRRGCSRMNWSVLEWNRLAIDFYERFDASRLSEWHQYRLDREALARLSGD